MLKKSRAVGGELPTCSLGYNLPFLATCTFQLRSPRAPDPPSLRSRGDLRACATSDNELRAAEAIPALL